MKIQYKTNRGIGMAALLLLPLSVFANNAVSPQLPAKTEGKNATELFTDDFSTKERFAANWITQGKCSHRDGALHIANTGSAQCRAALPEKFTIRVTVRPIRTIYDDPKKIGMFGFQFNGGSFLLRTDGFASGVFFQDGKWHGSSKKVGGFQLGKSYELSLTSHRLGDGDQVVFLVNGEKIAALTLPVRAANVKSILYSHNAEVVFDDFKLSQQ